MQGRLSEKEKQELRKLLEDQDKPLDNSWLRVEHYTKLSKKDNPFGFACALCSKTHHPSNCPHQNKKQETQKTQNNPGYYSWYNNEDEGY